MLHDPEDISKAFSFKNMASWSDRKLQEATRGSLTKNDNTIPADRFLGIFDTRNYICISSTKMGLSDLDFHLDQNSLELPTAASISW